MTSYVNRKKTNEVSIAQDFTLIFSKKGETKAVAVNQNELEDSCKSREIVSY